MRTLPLALLFAALILSEPCRAQETPPPAGKGPQGTVAVVDLDKVADELGLATQINQAMQRRQNLLLAQFEEFKQRGEAAVNRKQQQIGQTPTDAQKQELDELRYRLVSELQQRQATSQQELERLQLSIIAEVRQVLREPVRKVAEQRGIKVVLTRSDSVYYLEPSADLTAAVVAAVRAAPEPIRLSTAEAPPEEPAPATDEPPAANPPKGP